MDTITTGTVLSFVEEVRNALESDNITGALSALVLLEDICGIDEVAWNTSEDDELVDDGDIFDPDVVNDHCDYCGSDGMETYGVQNSETMACLDCSMNHSDLTSVHSYR
jgi:hypothetical protein